MTLTTSTKPSGAISYMGTPSDLADALARIVGTGSHTRQARPLHNEIVRAVDVPTSDMVRVILWTKYGLAPGIRMVTVACDENVWRVTDDDFIPTPEHKGAVTLFTPGARPDTTTNTPKNYPSPTR